MYIFCLSQKMKQIKDKRWYILTFTYKFILILNNLCPSFSLYLGQRKKKTFLSHMCFPSSSSPHISSCSFFLGTLFDTFIKCVKNRMRPSKLGHQHPFHQYVTITDSNFAFMCVCMSMPQQLYICGENGLSERLRRGNVLKIQHMALKM